MSITQPITVRFGLFGNRMVPPRPSNPSSVSVQSRESFDDRSRFLSPFPSPPASHRANDEFSAVTAKVRISPALPTASLHPQCFVHPMNAMPAALISSANANAATAIRIHLVQSGSGDGCFSDPILVWTCSPNEIELPIQSDTCRTCPSGGRDDNRG